MIAILRDLGISRTILMIFHNDKLKSLVHNKTVLKAMSTWISRVGECCGTVAAFQEYRENRARVKRQTFFFFFLNIELGFQISVELKTFPVEGSGGMTLKYSE